MSEDAGASAAAEGRGRAVAGLGDSGVPASDAPVDADAQARAAAALSEDEVQMRDASAAGVAASGLDAVAASVATRAPAELSASQPGGWRRGRELVVGIAELAALAADVGVVPDAFHRFLARTRSLLGADMAYFSRHDPDGAARIIETDGVFTEAYRTLTVPAGVGIVGRILTAGGPVMVTDYDHDTSFTRDSEVDRIVRAEGSRAILGVPVRVAGSVVGGLLVANRTPGAFDVEHSFALSTIADLAAVAFAQRERAGKQDAELAALRERHVALRERADLARRLVLADDALLDALAPDGTIALLRDGMQRALGRDIRLVDLTVRYDVLDAATEAGDDERPLIALSARVSEPVASTREDGRTLSVMAASRGEHVVGAVLADGELDGADETVMRRCARTLATYLTAQGRARGDLTLRRQELVEQLVAPPAGGLSESTVRRLAEHGVREGRPFRIVVGDGSASSLKEIDHRLELDYGASLLRTLVDEQLVAVMPERSFAQFRDMLEAPGARRWGNLLVGHSPTLTLLDIVPEELELVQRVVTAARSSSLPGQTKLVSLETYGAIGAFLSRVTIEPTRVAIRETLGPLLDYDAANDTELVATAFAYLDLGRSVARVAHRLHIHENTVRQRVDRIGRLLGRDWAEGQAGLDHHIMLAAHRLLA